MSKAFTREDDDVPEPPVLVRSSTLLPPGAKNYLTADGAARLRAQLSRLEGKSVSHQEPWSPMTRSIPELRAILSEAEIVQPPTEPVGQVCFGATVTVREEDRVVTHYRIVGVDETDLDRGWISWLSPLARALMNARVGERVAFRSPAGERTLEVMRIESTAPVS